MLVLVPVPVPPVPSAGAAGAAGAGVGRGSAGAGVGRGSAGARIRLLLPRRSPSGRGPHWRGVLGSRRGCRGLWRWRLWCRGGLLRRGVDGRGCLDSRRLLNGRRLLRIHLRLRLGHHGCLRGGGLLRRRLGRGGRRLRCGRRDGRRHDARRAACRNRRGVPRDRGQTENNGPDHDGRGRQPYQHHRTRRRVDGPPSHSSWVKFSSGRLSAGLAW